MGEPPISLREEIKNIHDIVIRGEQEIGYRHIL